MKANRPCTNCIPDKSHRCFNRPLPVGSSSLPPSLALSYSSVVSPRKLSASCPPTAILPGSPPSSSIGDPNPCHGIDSGTITVDNVVSGREATTCGPSPASLQCVRPNDDVPGRAVTAESSLSHVVRERNGACVRTQLNLDEDLGEAVTLDGPSSPLLFSNNDAISVMDLPTFPPISDGIFVWGKLNRDDFVHVIESSYSEVVHWRRNSFLVPSGAVGKDFVAELSRLFLAYAESSALECIALKAATVLQVLLLQRPHADSRAKNHVECLRRRLAAWKEGDVNGLVCEGRALQFSLSQRNSREQGEEHFARVFGRLMIQGKVKAAIRWLSQSTSRGVLPLDKVVGDGSRTVYDVLLDKHPVPQELDPDAVISVSSPVIQQQPAHAVLFDRLNGQMIKTAALRTDGAAGPSGVDAAGWRRLCTAFHGASRSLCDAIAKFARRIATDYVDPSGLAAFVACRLIPLDKSPGVRPIGICETVRRIVGKAIMAITGRYVKSAAGPLQLCAGHQAGCEAAVHAIRQLFHHDDTDGILLVDATNAFNSLNRAAALRNIMRLCPIVAPVIINTYRCQTELFAMGKVVLSREGTTQGDPLAMTMYALAMVPLITAIQTDNAAQVWFADDATSAGRLLRLRAWWDALISKGPSYGYFPNAAKTWLVVKEGLMAEAHSAFADTGVRISCEGRPCLGAAIGTSAYVDRFVSSKIEEWVAEVERLSKIALSHPQASYAALTHGLVGRWTYVLRTIPTIAALLDPLETAVRCKLLPAMLNRPAVNACDWKVLCLPVRHGGLGLPSPLHLAAVEPAVSLAVTAPLTKVIIKQSMSLGSVPEDQLKIKLEQRREKVRRLHEHAASTTSVLPPFLKRSVELASEKGASAWLTVLPVSEHNFDLTKAAFRDAVCLRYGWSVPDLPSTCVCGSVFTVSHSLHCPTGGFPTIRHNELRDLLAGLMSEVCPDVSTEPLLLPLSGETMTLRSASTDAEARLDISARGFFGARLEKAFFDVRVFNPSAPSNQGPIKATYRRHELEKRRKYGQRVREIEHASFVPVVFSCASGAGPAATVVLKRLAALIADRRDLTYSVCMAWLRARVCFALLRSSLMCLRGSRVGRRRFVDSSTIPLAVAESRLSCF